MQYSTHGGYNINSDLEMDDEIDGLPYGDPKSYRGLYLLLYTLLIAQLANVLDLFLCFKNISWISDSILKYAVVFLQRVQLQLNLLRTLTMSTLPFKRNPQNKTS